MSSVASSVSFRDHFEEVSDPRIDRSKVHPLLDVLFLAVTATLAGADGPSDIEQFGQEKIDRLRRFVELPGGIPSHDTIGRLFAAIKPDQFQKAFLRWIETITTTTSDKGPKFVPIDGKTVRGSYTEADKSNPLHLVSAWATKQGLTLGQVATDQKSNEITAPFFTGRCMVRVSFVSSATPCSSKNNCLWPAGISKRALSCFCPSSGGPVASDIANIATTNAKLNGARFMTEHGTLRHSITSTRRARIRPPHSAVC